jgi:hypothetical protein
MRSFITCTPCQNDQIKENVLIEVCIMGKPEGKRSLGSRRRWEDNIKMDHR